MLRSVPAALGAAAIAVATLAASGCGTDRIYLRPHAPELIVSSDEPPAVLRRVPPGSARGLDLTISSPGAAKLEEDNREGMRLPVRVVAENRGDDHARVHPGDISLQLEDGRRLSPREIWVGGSRQAGPVDIPAGERRSFEIVFEDDRDDIDLEEIAPVRFSITPVVGGTSQPVGVEFGRVRTRCYAYAPVYAYPAYYPYAYDPFYDRPSWRYRYWGPYYPYGYGYHR